MKRSELEKSLGKNVRITLFNNKVIEGELHKTGEEMFKTVLSLYLPRNRYFVINTEISFLFRCSHVKKLEEISND